MRKLVILISLWFFSTCLLAQKGVNAFAVQFRPIFPLGLVNTDGQIFSDASNSTTLNMKVNSGYSLGALLRFGLSKRFSIETGISYTARNYTFDLESDDYENSSAELKFPGYEIPLMGMVFVRLGERVFMNVSAGMIFDLFPTGGLAVYDRDSIEYGMLENSWIQLGLGANLGFEFRTEKNGYFYLGASYHNTIGDMADVYINYRKSNTNEFVQMIDPYPSVDGNYLSLDLRYYFNPGKRDKSKE